MVGVSGCAVGTGKASRVWPVPDKFGRRAVSAAAAARLGVKARTSRSSAARRHKVGRSAERWRIHEGKSTDMVFELPIGASVLPF